MRCRTKYQLELDEVILLQPQSSKALSDVLQPTFEAAKQEHAQCIQELQKQVESREGEVRLQFNVTTTKSAQSVRVAAFPDSTIKSVADALGVDSNVTFAGVVLQPDTTLESQGVSANATLEVASIASDSMYELNVPSKEALQLKGVMACPPDPEKFQVNIGRCVCCTWEQSDSLDIGEHQC